MRKEWIWLIGLSIFVILIIPWSVLKWHKEAPGNDALIRVLLPNGQIEKLKLEEYLVGVVAAEMPAEFETEALKAQAVAARTYAAKRLSQTSLPNVGYDVDTTVQTQSWSSDSQLRTKWGWLNFWRYYSKIQKAVAQTRSMVLISDGQYIDAFYHSSSGRKPTERSEEVWSSPRTYLQNVSSEEENKLRYVKAFTFTPQELSQKLGIKGFDRSINAGDIEIISRTKAGRAKNVKIFGKVFLATQLRTLLGLPSTDIEWVIQSNTIKITAYGNGHAVGMSQWGANDMAKRNMNYETILSHFYPGAKIMKLEYGQGK